MKLIALGPLAQVAAIEDENRAGDMNAVGRILQDLAFDEDISILLAHHRRKPASGSAVPRRESEFFNSARGSSALMGIVEGGIGIAREQGEEQAWLYLEQRSARSAIEPLTFDERTLTFGKSIGPIPTSTKYLVVIREALADRGSLTALEAGKLANCSPTTARQRLLDLVKKGTAELQQGPSGAHIFVSNQPTQADTNNPSASQESITP